MSEKTDDKANEKADEKNQKNGGGGGNGLRRIHRVIFSKFGRGARVVLVVLLLVAGYGAYAWYAARKSASETPKHITAVVNRGDITRSVLASGALQAFKSVKVGAQVSGKISALYVNIGDRVKAGDPIADIDASTQQNARDSAAAELASSKAALLTAQAKLEEARQRHDRQKTLVDKGAAARETLESAVAALKSAKSAVAQARADIQKSQLNLDNAGVTLGYTRVTAPMDGVVVSVAVEKGQTVNAVQDSPTLVTIAQTDTMTVKAEIAEADVSELKPGMSAYFTLLGADKKRYEGVLESIDPAPLATSNSTTATSAATTSSNTETAVYYYGKMDVPNPEGKLRIGMTANMVITVGEAKNVLIVPMTALQARKEGKGEEVLVAEHGKTRTQTVKTGLEDGVNVEILEGLNEGEEVVVSTAVSGAGSLPRGGPGGPGGPF